MEKLLDLAAQYDGVKTKILPNGVQFKKDKKSVTYYPSTGTVVSDENGKIKVNKRAGMELLKKELHAAFYQPVDLYKTSDMENKEMKEYLEPMPNGDYRYHRDEGFSIGGDWIEVPEGASHLLNTSTNNPKQLNFYKLSGENKYWFGNGEWIKSHDVQSNFENNSVVWQRPTTKSEYLVDIRGKWELQLLTSDTPESETCVRVPEGANAYIKYKSFPDSNFVKIGNPSFVLIIGKWEAACEQYTSVGNFINDDHVVLWQRETLNDKIASAEKSRADLYGMDDHIRKMMNLNCRCSLESLPFTTPELSEEYQALCDRVEAIDKEAARYMREEAPMLDSFNNDGPLIESFNWAEPPHGYNYWSKLEKSLLEPLSYNHIGEAKEAPSAAIGEHSHYFKDVSKLEVIDVYAVLELFGVTNPCMQHIVKKALCTGKRGHKDFAKDLQDIADTANRAVELNKQFYG